MPVHVSRTVRQVKSLPSFKNVSTAIFAGLCWVICFGAEQEISQRAEKRYHGCPPEKLYPDSKLKPRLMKFLICWPCQWHRMNQQDFFCATGWGTGRKCWYDLQKTFLLIYAAMRTYLWCKPPSTETEMSLLGPEIFGCLVCKTGVSPLRPWCDRATW